MTSCFVARISNPGERFGKPFYEVDVPSPLIPCLYLNGISTGNSQEALVGPECPGLSANTITTGSECGNEKPQCLPRGVSLSPVRRPL